ncbi:hypothetical protein BYT27DRAFT_7198651 [Phlegmacium glaucopus]|nr:hypothetical protein BYT27DRAFT_7198651 [Phlegmacium glaucopus]
MPESLDRSLSSLSLNSVPEDDWDRSLPDTQENAPATTPRNSVVFPVDDTPGKSSQYNHNENAGVQESKGNRTLSELLRLHSEKDSKGNFSPEEAARIADVLGQWINASSSPYEAEDDFFVRSGQSMDDLSIASKRPSAVDFGFGRPRGRSECTNSPSNSRPPSSTGFVPS